MKSAEQHIAEAVRALPYRSPRAGFSARVMAAVLAGNEKPAWTLAGAAELLVAVWSGIVVYAAAAFIWANWASVAAFLIKPGEAGSALGLAAAKGAMLAGKAFGLLQLAAAAAPLPAWQEMAAASLVSSAIVYALGGRLAAQRI